MALMLFPIQAFVVSLVAYLYPPVFMALKPSILPLLMLVMLSMGLTLNWRDFLQVWNYRTSVATGVAVQFVIMPLAAWLISLLLGLSEALTVGMMLVGATAGGTASNVITFLAKGNVALSVSMTMVSTLTAVLMLPILTWLYLGHSVDVPALAMLGTLLKVIVLPVFAGMLLNHFWRTELASFSAWFTTFSMAAILLIVAIVVALNSENLSTVAWPVVIAVILHNLIGLSSGYFVARRLGCDSVIARTVAIEVGMQNSGLSVALALKYFTAASAIPGAIFSIWHNLSGALFASYWSNKTDQTNEQQKP
ncbi:bile acid:sodium symporter family protein [Alteromonas lipolytica]|uniref:Bile acid:sodium symporter n=1 Tax=Alteromonas lipolytica TaxID=1856405 RepID=A0A1E8FC13_9ALTE|nr:bile acid:sodium symporter family protein [Alteromonas lipolytica]OFI33450.1 bile acid:sodium symporter [Alteromonas lipolytica]GGF59585.1 sodium transporter [Alteromonas lipolytica]